MTTDRVQAQEEKVDAGITKVQGWLERLKQSPHTAWIIIIVAGTVFFTLGLAVIFL